MYEWSVTIGWVSLPSFVDFIDYIGCNSLGVSLICIMCTWVSCHINKQINIINYLYLYTLYSYYVILLYVDSFNFFLLLLCMALKIVVQLSFVWM